MDHNGWYAQQNGHARYHQPQPESTGLVAPESAHRDAHRLLAVYPFASATPTNHVARHLNGLTANATTPSYVQPQYYAMNGYNYPSANPPPYSEYAPQMLVLQSQQVPTNDSTYWTNTRNEAVRYLGQPGTQPFPQYQPSTDYWTSHSQPSYPTSAFAQSVFQHTMPTMSYPTPSPGIQPSSSSLANALVERPPAPPKKLYPPHESASFFNDFLDKSSRELELSQAAKFTTPRTPSKPSGRSTSFTESPDPIAMGAVVTPLKRKPADDMQSPSFKRIHSLNRTPSSSSLSGPPSTPSTSSQASASTQGTPASRTATPTAVRRKMMPYVELPPKPKVWTPSMLSAKKAVPKTPQTLKGKGRMRMDEDEDLGGFGSEEEGFKPRKTSLAMNDVPRSSAKRTGGREDRGPLEKFSALVEDVFEAEDALPADAELESLPLEFFSPLTVEPARPQLHPNIIRKLTKHITQVVRPAKRVRTQSAAGQTPRAKGPLSIADLEIPTLARILKILERSVRAGEDLDPFLSDRPAEPRGVTVSPSKKKSAKARKALGERRSKSKTPGVEGEGAGAGREGTPMDVDPQVDMSDLDKLSRLLDIARDSILAADCCIALLGSDRLPKQVYSEELITVCLAAIKNQLNKVIYPFVEASTDSSQISPVLRHLVKSPAAVKEQREKVAEVFQALTSVLPRINNLVCADTVAMSDSIIIQAVYIAVGPFFVTESEGEGKGKKENVVLNTLGHSAMRGFRLEALSLIRSIFGNHEDQRSWIIEEILSSLIKLSDTKQKAGQFRLRDGRSIRTVSALLLQLVQTSAHGVRVDARRLGKARQQTLALRRQESLNDKEKLKEPFLDQTDVEEINLYTSGLESATKSAKTIVIFLTQRSGKGKSTKNSNEAEYRAIFDNLVSDLLVVLFWPEWPAASLLLSIICKFMVSSLDDIKTNNQTDNNAAKTLALDHLGVVAARLRSSNLKFKPSGPEDKGTVALKSLDEILAAASVQELDRLVNAHQDVATHLSKRSSEEQAYDSARELTAVTWGQELAIALKTCNVTLSGADDGDNLQLPKAQPPKFLSFATKVKSALREVWKDALNDVFDIGSQEEALRIDRLAEEIGIVQDLRNSYHPILNVILMALDAPPVFMRTKALRALGQIVTSDPTILSSANVRHGIESHLLDSSPAVRDAAVELIGKYMIDSPEVASDYYQKIADRMADTGLGVRKRVIKLLKSFYGVIDDTRRRIDIMTRLVLRMYDEDDTVKDLAVKTVEELWFPAPTTVSQKPRSTSSITNDDKTQLLEKVAIIMGVAANFNHKDRQSPLEDLLHKIIATKDGTEAQNLYGRYAEICEALIDGLVDATDLPGFTTVNCIRTIHLFSSAHPAVFSGTNASTLLPYLKNATTPEEQHISDYLLKIFRVSIPHMPKTAAKFGQELQQALQPMIVKPSVAGGIAALQELVACLCAVVQHLTHEFVSLARLLASCNARIQHCLKSTSPLQAQEGRTLTVLTFIIALLVENCNFDRVRVEHPDVSKDIDNVTKGSVIEYTYRTMLALYTKYKDPAARGRTLQCLGFLFRAHPSLMTLDTSATIMDDIFSSPEEDGRTRLLKIMQDFLVSEAAKHALKEKNAVGGKAIPVSDVNMDELIGNTDGFADSGVSSAVVQRYLDPILKAALSQNAQTQGVAVDILSFTIKQGLAHPLQSFPVIVSLETSPNTSLSSRASALHAILHTKHASLLNSRYIVSARATFDYQKTLASDDHPVHGYRMLPMPTALLQRWYNHVREKRPSKIEFIKALMRIFDLSTKLSSSQDDVEFARYMAENFSAMEYKMAEEVLLVIKTLTGVLSTAGMQCVEQLQPEGLVGLLKESVQASEVRPQADGDVVMGDVTLTGPAQSSTTSVQTLDKLSLLRSSVILAIIMQLKSYLKTLYSLSEDKCLKYVPGKKSAVGDKAVTRRHDTTLTWDRLPYAVKPLLTVEDMEAQRDSFLAIWHEDGVTQEPDDDGL
ncbi:hypothetical protein OF83DRAFT_1120276 [Amylostereum chailletii]|nr:hypothetical protein OF83DRAFT_1120276 [Amylostereum chailletii]